MITIDQLLESVDLDFEPRWVTKNQNGAIKIWEEKPEKNQPMGWWFNCLDCSHIQFLGLKLSEFDGKDWTECIYEVPRKTTGKIERFIPADFATIRDINEYVRSVLDSRAFDKLNMLVDAVNELKGLNDGKKLFL
jgi:hypothetical protein